MASIVRPTLRACQAAPASRLLTTRAPAASVFRLHAPLTRTPVKPSFVRDALPAARIAPFHASASRAILPPLPQRVQGTANDPAPVPPVSATHGSYHWSFERVIAAALIPLTVAPFAAGTLNPVSDAVFGALLVLHTHIGFQSVIIDYLPKYRVPGVFKLFSWLLNGATLLVAYGIYEFETNDVGITEAVKRVWTAKQ
ncbi:Cytochrome b succinate dehydrogenase small subunit CybS [Lasiodiplodia theobromae]|uniref:Succinate dehydrogenase [ubiquinone] cytochrome b small subunit n=2 Tax=Lasiodiplodia TaxID=66739 RepID=A0A5N5DRY9_9PEZI|nr:Cytochrome b succinate dehydrogenase small subunit CybS [Lasiodiplodia theobromae]KAB2580778.1 Succinate dehydrogenase (ubiquinone) cytochrome b small subunit [Lasiodiplodia theobromae]KAF4542387.1 Cytochrome b succinate dehydrogenase small subunit CybS [Lasiodiplodia theobromae]KAF9635849.1 Cytochrome b succinate dehydrogenase small subunit CybS [Lasiodiplodia theobromae]KAK0653907.1 Succinate dehydrogenase (ubiquinone) cytochrome b small subunit [Lasiodiplodia hormozganensis]